MTVCTPSGVRVLSITYVGKEDLHSDPRRRPRFTTRRPLGASLARQLLPLRSLLVTAGLVLALPAAAGAATLEAAKSCYPNGSKARLVGSGFAPESTIRFAVNGRTLEQLVSSDEAGDVVVTYSPPDTETEQKLVIRATDEEGTYARTTIYVTRQLRVTADPPSSSNVRTWRAVFRLYGFGSGRAYIHYVNPKGRFKKTVRLGRLIGPCGRLKSDRRRVMPFDDPQFGFWRLQFDTRRRYSKDTARKRVIPVRVYRG